jgi:hypothetical protein
MARKSGQICFSFPYSDSIAITLVLAQAPADDIAIKAPSSALQAARKKASELLDLTGSIRSQTVQE